VRGAHEETAAAPVGTGSAGWIALALAALHLAAAPWAGTLGPGGQVAYLAMLAVPAAVLAWGEGLATALRGAWSWRASLPTAAVIAVWVASRLVTDLGSPVPPTSSTLARVSRYRALRAGTRPFTDLFDPALPASTARSSLRADPTRARLVPFSLRAVRCSSPLSPRRPGVGVLARVLIGAHVASSRPPSSSRPTPGS
jgi:hypothetical protein